MSLENLFAVSLLYGAYAIGAIITLIGISIGHARVDNPKLKGGKLVLMFVTVSLLWIIVVPIAYFIRRNGKSR